MTIVEFFDIASLENICSALLCQPDKVIMIGHDSGRLKHTIDLYTDIVRSKNINTEFSFAAVSKNNLNSIVNKLEEIVAENPSDCIFDLTGGDDLYLVAVGIIMEKYRGRVQCHRFNFMNDKLSDCDADGKVLKAKSFELSVADNIAIYDGKILTDGEHYTYDWDFNDDFLKDIGRMWTICAKKPGLWNLQIGAIGAICDTFIMPSDLEVLFYQDDAEEALRQNHVKYACIPWFLGELQKKGLISALDIGEKVYFKFKNDQVKKCLTIAGQALELQVAKTLRLAKDKDGSPLYNDVKVGSVINWGYKDDNDSTINEIDVIAMKGVIPIFISCKNGFFDSNELYKLNSVADKFGNKYAKKILICTELDKLGSAAEYLVARMDDMNIRCIDNVDQMPEREFEQILASIWKTDY